MVHTYFVRLGSVSWFDAHLPLVMDTVKNGKGSKSRITSFRKFWNNWPKSMGPKTKDMLVGGDRTHELVPVQTDGGGIRLVSPTHLPDYPRDG